jgi:hypothetical protein
VRAGEPKKSQQISRKFAPLYVTPAACKHRPADIRRKRLSGELMSRIIWGVLVALVLASAANADAMTVKDYVDLSHRDPAVLARIGAAAYGVVSMDIYVGVARKETQFFCPPEKVFLTDDQSRDILERYINEHAHEAKADSSAFAIVLVRAFVDVFPCK